MNTRIFYDQWTDLLKKSIPSLENPEEMTASIMEKIENLPVNTSSKKITYWTTLMLGAAACCLFCLLIHELNRPLMNTMPSNTLVSTMTKNPIPEKIEEIPLIMKEKEQRAVACRDLRKRLAQNYSYLSSSEM